MSHVIHDFAQGSDAWHAHRAKHFNASEAPVILGISPYQTRGDLLKAKALGLTADVSASQQVIFDNGHRFEAMARPWAEGLLGSELYPIVASLEVDGLPLSASYDGVTMSEDAIFEHKTLTKDIAASLDAGVIPEYYRAQMEQQLLIIGAQRALFMASNGDQAGLRHEWYETDPKMRARLIAGWKQFAEDLQNYQHVDIPVKPAGQALLALPSLAVELIGEVKGSNLALYRDSANRFVAEIKTDLATDEDFATAENTVKFLEAEEKKLAFAREQALGQMTSISAFFATVKQITEAFRSKRLELDNLVESKKESIKARIRQEGIDLFNAHLETLNKRFERSYMTGTPPPDFAAAMKGKKTISSLRNAMDVALTHGKMAASATADRITINLRVLRSIGGEFDFLFPDESSLVLKDAEALEAIVKGRVAEHKAAEARREEKIREDERLRQAATAQAAAQPAPAPTTARPVEPKPQLSAEEIDELGGREALEAWVKRYGSQRAFATIAASIRSFLNSSGKRRRAA